MKKVFKIIGIIVIVIVALVIAYQIFIVISDKIYDNNVKKEQEKLQEERINAKDVLKMATINGAKLLGLEDKIGSIEVGKRADIIIVNISDKLDNVKMLPNIDIVSNLVYNADGKNVDTTIVNGQVLMENRNVKVIDTNKVVKKIKIKSK